MLEMDYFESREVDIWEETYLFLFPSILNLLTDDNFSFLLVQLDQMQGCAPWENCF